VAGRRNILGARDSCSYHMLEGRVKRQFFLSRRGSISEERCGSLSRIKRSHPEDIRHPSYRTSSDLESPLVTIIGRAVQYGPRQSC
jgi:hypothetical protein